MIPEELKLCVLKLAAGRHRSNKINKCPKNPSNTDAPSRQKDPMVFRRQHYLFDEKNFDLIQRLEDKIMERMNIQMERLYQKLEKKITEH